MRQKTLCVAEEASVFFGFKGLARWTPDPVTNGMTLEMCNWGEIHPTYRGPIPPFIAM